MNVGAEAPQQEGQSFFEAVGGHATFERIVRRFYAGVADDPILAPMYPEDDMDGAVWRLTTFLEQYWGGLTTYSMSAATPACACATTPSTSTPRPATTGSL